MAPRLFHVLIVEDDDSNRLVIETALRGLDVDVVIARDGEEALRCVDSQEPDLILLDLMMPRMNGYQFLRAYREDRQVMTPVIVVSAKNEATDRFWAERLGVVGYVTKPFASAQLRLLIEETLAEHAEPRSLP